MIQFTIVYLNVDERPKETHSTIIEAISADAALFQFINDPSFNDQFVACIIYPDGWVCGTVERPISKPFLKRTTR